MSRIAKNNAMKAIYNSKDDSLPLEAGECEDTVETSDAILNGKPFTVPVTSQNAPEGFSLDLFKQYKRRVDFCERDLIRIHDKSVNKKDNGSENKGLIYIDFNA